MKILKQPPHLEKTVYEMLLPLFTKEVFTDLGLLKQASIQNNWIEVKRVAHKIAGVASSYGALEVNEIASSIETSLNQQDKIDNQTIENLEQAISRLKEYILSEYTQPNK